MKKLLLILIFLFLPLDLLAFNASVNDVKITVDYTEPTVNADGSALTDLNHTSIYYSISGGTAVKATDVNASSVNGGGIISQQITIPISNGQEADVDVWATATDNSGNESANSITVTVRIDKLAPGAPQ